MAQFELNNFRSELNAGFLKIDEQKAAFTRELLEKILDILLEAPLGNDVFGKLNAKLSVFAEQLFSTVNAVIEKDANYTGQRLEEEHFAMARVMENVEEQKPFRSYEIRIHQKSKEVIVRHFPGIFDLSGNGFRLLEKYCRLFSHEFMLNLDTLSIINP